MTRTPKPQRRKNRAARSAESDPPLASSQKRKATAPPSTPRSSCKRMSQYSVSESESEVPLTRPRKRKSTAAASKPPDNSKRIQVKTEVPSPTKAQIARSTIPMTKSVYPCYCLWQELTVHLHYSPIYGAIIDFKIGESGTSFAIHRGLLCRASSFFKQQLSESEVAEDSIIARSIELKDDDPEIFDRFNTWLYSEQIRSESETYGDLPWHVIFDVYAFAERTGTPRLQNHCVDAVIRKKRRGGALFPGRGDVNALWERRWDSHRLRKLLLDLFAESCNLTKAIANNGPFHPMFLQGLVQTLYEMKAKGTMSDRVNFWQKRHDYYVADPQNPISLD